MKTLTFNAVITHAGGGGMYVVVPYDIEAEFGVKRLPARATFDGEPYRGTVLRMGTPNFMIPVLKNIRTKIGKGEGDTITVTITRDDEPRDVAVPDDFARALDGDTRARHFFDALSYTHRREYVMWIEEAKRSDTRERRIVKALEMLREGKKGR